MDRIRGQITTPVLIAAGVGLVLGLVLGLLFAYYVSPLEWTDLDMSSARADLQREYLAYSVQSFAQTGDVQEATRRFGELGEAGNDRLAELAANPPAPVSPEQVNSFATVVGAGGLPPAGVTTPGAPGTGEEPAPRSNTLTVVLGAMCVLTLIIGGLLAYLFVFRNRKPSIASTATRGSVSPVGRVEPTGFAEGQEPPIVQYLTTYTMGNDLYDDSFSIDSPTGEFLGECGVGISETIGVGDPKKVTAFEVWLFDKNDIQTVTKVVMSEHAFNDPGISQRLTSKGEPVLAEPGKRIVLETATLQLEARVVNMNYGQGALPQNSFFDQMTLELAVWPLRK